MMIKPDTRATDRATARHLVVVQGWTEELKRLVPTK
jgi:hypothetical protein